MAGRDGEGGGGQPNSLSSATGLACIPLQNSNIATKREHTS